MNSEELIKLLIQFSKSDSEFNEKELVYILNVATRLDVGQSQLEDWIKSAPVVDISVPESEQERMRVFYYLLFLMKIDRQVSDQEVEAIHHFGFKLGFSRAMINDFVDVVKNHTDKEIPVSVMIDIIKRYQN